MTDDIAMENARLFEIERVSGNIAQTAIVLRRMVLDMRVPLIADERAAFEVWLTDLFKTGSDSMPNFSLDDGSGDHYLDAEVSNAWLAWQARARLSAAPTLAFTQNLIY